MKRWLVGLLLVVLAGVLLVSVINNNRDPIAVLEEWGVRGEKRYGVKTITRNDKGEVVEVFLHRAHISPPSQQILYLVGLGSKKRFLSDAELVHLKGLTSLKSLDLGGYMHMTDGGLEHLKGLTTLQTLILPEQITDAGLLHLKGVTELQALNLGNTKITDTGLLHLKRLPRLQGLFLRGTKITDAGLAHLKGLTNLETLWLSHCNQVTDAGLVHLKGVINLKSLNLRDTQISDAGVADLQKSLPNCKISK
jgi:hypothetical protein